MKDFEKFAADFAAGSEGFDLAKAWEYGFLKGIDNVLALAVEDRGRWIIDSELVIQLIEKES